MRLGTVYIYGLNLIASIKRVQYADPCPEELIAFFVQNAHGDVVQLLDPDDNTVSKSYIYDAFGNELDPSPTDTNYLRYCGEYLDYERGEYYLRARNYDPRTGRFTQEDTHWNVSNMLYGDNPSKINARKDPLGLNVYTYVPDINAIMQSGNLYVYCMNNPLMYQDQSGEIAQALLWGTGAANAWNPVGWVLLGAAAVLTVATIIIIADHAVQEYQNAQKNKPLSLPSANKIKINMDHIMSGHGAGGDRGGPNKDRFPLEMTAPMIEKIIREAYKYAEKLGSLQRSWENGVEMVRQFFQGPWDGGTIQFWYNYTTKTIETAWPK